MVWVTYEVKIEVKMGICLCYAGMPESVRIKVIKLALYLVVWFRSKLSELITKLTRLTLDPEKMGIEA